VPCIADYTTVVWILEKGIGGTIRIQDEAGHPEDLRIVGILHDSIFQGSIFISESCIRALYPTQSQYDHFLVRVGEGSGGNGGSGRDAQVKAAAELLESALADYGMSARPVKDIVLDFVKVDLAYVSILQAMLASGVILGTLGFGAKVARETLERRHELGVMRAVGFQKATLLGLMLGENLFIFLLGFGTAALAAVLSALLFLGMVPPPVETLELLLFLLAVIIAATLVPLRKAMGRSAADNLRTLE
jgi:putative ABC transport system permease protein